MKKFFFAFLILPILAIGAEDIGTLTVFQGKVLINNKPATKNQKLKIGDSIIIPSMGYATVEYSSGTRETFRTSAILDKVKIEKYQNFQNSVEKLKNNLGVKGFEANISPTAYEKQQEELRILYNNSEYEKLISFVTTSKMNINHPDNLFKVAIAYFRVGDISIAKTHLKKLKSYDIPEYEDYIDALYIACLYLTNDKEAKKLHSSIIHKQGENKFVEELKLFND